MADLMATFGGLENVYTLGFFCCLERVLCIPIPSLFLRLDNDRCVMELKAYFWKW
jgi:hypothetical protein